MSTVKLSLLVQLFCGGIVFGMRSGPEPERAPLEAPLHHMFEAPETIDDLLQDTSAFLQMIRDLRDEPAMQVPVAAPEGDMEVVEEVEEVVPAQRHYDAADLELAADLTAMEDRSIMAALRSPFMVDSLISGGAFTHDGGHGAQVYLDYLLNLPPVELLAIPHASYSAAQLFRCVPESVRYLFIRRLFNLPGAPPKTMEEFVTDDAYARFQLDLLVRITQITRESPSHLIDQYADFKRLNYYVFAQFMNHFNRQGLFAQARKAYFVEVFGEILKTYPSLDFELFELIIEAGVRFQDILHLLSGSNNRFEEHFREVFAVFSGAQEASDIVNSFGTGDMAMDLYQPLNVSEYVDPIQSYDF